MKQLLIVIMMALGFVSMTAQTPTVEWYTLGNMTDVDGKPYHIERFVIQSGGGIRKLCFNRFARKMETVNKLDTITEIIPGYYYISSPRLFGKGGRDVTIELRLPWALENFNYEPDGFHAVMSDGRVVPVRFTRQSLLADRSHWAGQTRDVMPSGAAIYDFNETLSCVEPLTAYDVIPSFKSVQLMKDERKVDCKSRVIYKPISDERPDYYCITVAGDSIEVGYTNKTSRTMAAKVLQSKILSRTDSIDAAFIEDWPSLPYRAVMIDIARNYFDIRELQKIVHLLASYRMNVLHLHPFDDEGWRIEIPGLPELTDVGARRGYTTDESDYLAQLFAGDGNPDNNSTTSNGYITREEFVDFLRYCTDLGVNVITEIESPGHARAAIKAMRARAVRTGDDSYLLDELTGNNSVYTSAQSFHDNVMNPALTGPYKFMEKVIDELISMYDEAGAPLLGIHIGGDEVPAKAWDGSPRVQEMMTREGMTTHRQVHAAFVDSIASILSSRGVKMYAWQEVALDHTDEYNSRIAPLTAGVNCWTNVSGGNPAKIVKSGFPVILSCVDRFYMDQCYNTHPMEQGLTWGGTVDEFVSLSGYPMSMGVEIDSVSAAGGSVIGISGQLFGETLRHPAHIGYMLLPKMFGLAERAWNTDSTYSNSRFNSVVAAELRSLAARGYNFHVRQPGLKIENGMAYMNTPYRDSVIRYTLDGSEPDENSPIYSDPVPVKPEDMPRARLYYLGRKSMTTFP